MNVYELFQRKSGRCCRKDKRIGKLRSPDIRDRPAHVPFYCTDPDRLVLCFVLGAVMLVFGMGFFSLGADVSMTPIGNKIGTALT